MRGEVRGMKNADYVREELLKDFDAPAAVIINRLGAIGVQNITNQQIYNQRNLLRAKRKEMQQKRSMTKQLNQIPLHEYIIKILMEKDGLTDRQLLGAVRDQGYVTHSEDFISVLRKRLYQMVDVRTLHREGELYKLTIRAKHAAEKQVLKEEAESVPDFKKQPAEKEAQDGDGNSDYELLCQSIINFAKAKGLENPESFPNQLIATQRQYNEKQRVIEKQKQLIAQAEQEALAFSIASLQIFNENVPEVPAPIQKIEQNNGLPSEADIERLVAVAQNLS